ncbi:hypothetical protein AVEN_93283-1 [Araneus ventricosus]|uniref:Uncharacterized protein n=1 Tax=Araneus ventricosus TaxID=182803 RepID=A0A4Y2TQ30_ARAVE|nr:hypothetical protein AVEN_93283-1 [Araneus ventricosus]
MINSAMISSVDELMQQNRRITTREIAVELSISKETVHHIVHKKLGVRAKHGVDMVGLGDPGLTRSPKAEGTGPGRKRSIIATLTDLKICQAVYEQDQAIKVDDSDGDECVEENPPTNAKMRHT